MAAADALRSKVTNAAAIALVASSAATRRYGFCLQKRSRRAYSGSHIGIFDRPHMRFAVFLIYQLASCVSFRATSAFTNIRRCS